MTNDALKVYLSETDMLQDVIGEITAERDRLREINAELLEALIQARKDYKIVVENGVFKFHEAGIMVDEFNPSRDPATIRMVAAIAKAQEEAS